MPAVLISILRTFVPALWGSVLAWAVSRGWLTAELASSMGPWSVGLTALVLAGSTAAWYALWRVLEPRLPDWVRRLVLGAAQAPSYTVSPGRHTPLGDTPPGSGG